MERANLAAMADEAQSIRASMRSLRNWMNVSEDHALGETNTETGEEIVPGNGDDFEVFEDAQKRLGEADLAMQRAVDILATAEGYRRFEEAEITR